MFILKNYDSALLFCVVQMLFSISLVCNKNRYYKLGKFLTLISTNYSVFALSFTYGHDSGFYLYYFTSPLIIYSFFHFYQFRQTILGLILYLSSYGIIEFANYKNIQPIIKVSPEILSSLYYLNVMMAFAFLIVLTSSFSKFQNDIAKEVQAKNTELETNQIELEKLLSEKNTLLSETHHRVKNNLAVISGLFDLQLMYDKDPRLKELLTNSKNRIKSMSLIHESLYHQSNVSKIDLRTYIEDLVNEIAKTQSSSVPIQLQFDLDEVYLDLSQSIPCGLIINEVVSNCFKHAFENSDNPVIKISLKLEHGIKLVIKDNGSGIDLANSEDINSLGMTLIDAFTRQLEGDFSYRIEKGTEFSLNFDYIA
jgi:two-component sensor histidine kinase